MNIKELIEKIGRERINHYLFIFSIGLALNGFFQFIYLWLQGNWFKSTAYWIQEGGGYNGINSFSNYLIWFTQVYLCLFIPLIVYLGFRYKNKLNGKILKIFSVFVFSFLFIFLEFSFSVNILYEWIILFMIIYCIMVLRFSVVFSFSFSLLSFQVANMLWEMAEINIHSIGTILSYILVYSIFIFVLHKLKVKFNLFIFLCLIPMFFSWIYFYSLWSAWSTNKMINYLNEVNIFSSYFRLFVFPFFIVIVLSIYFNYRKKFISK
jgi:hypothetical protein